MFKSASVDDVIMTWPIKDTYTGRTVLRKVVRGGLLLVAPVQIHNTDGHLCYARESDNVNVVALLVHGLHFMAAKVLHAGVVSLDKAQIEV